MMTFRPRFTSLFLSLSLALGPIAAAASAVDAGPSLVARFDAEVARLASVEGEPAEPSVEHAAARTSPRMKRSGADFSVQRRLNIDVSFPGDIRGSMYGGLFHGEAAVFTRAGNSLDATVLRNGDTEVMSFAASADELARAERAPRDGTQASTRPRRSVGPGHFEDPAAYNLHFHFLKHDDLITHDARQLHARFVAWWLADMAINVLQTETMHASYLDQMPWVTSMSYGGVDSLRQLELTLKTMDARYGLGVDQSYKHKYVLLIAGRPMPGTAGVAYEGGNEAIASVGGRSRIVAHEIGHMLGATHVAGETRGWWGCETNMLSITSAVRNDCLEYSAANRRAIRSYMRHGPDTYAPRRMMDAPSTD